MSAVKFIENIFRLFSCFPVLLPAWEPFVATRRRIYWPNLHAAWKPQRGFLCGGGSYYTHYTEWTDLSLTFAEDEFLCKNPTTTPVRWMAAPGSPMSAYLSGHLPVQWGQTWRHLHYNFLQIQERFCHLFYWNDYYLSDIVKIIVQLSPDFGSNHHHYRNKPGALGPLLGIWWSSKLLYRIIFLATSCLT